MLSPISLQYPVDVFQETTTIGLRVRECSRAALPRSFHRVETPWGPVSMKVAKAGDNIINAHPEYEDCASLAKQHGVALKAVTDYAKHAYLLQLASQSSLP